MAKILLVEDDTRLSDPLVRWMTVEGHQIDLMESGERALEALKSNHYDVIVLDWGLPGISGLDVVKQYRESGGLTPIIFLTGKIEVASKKVGLDAGADDYLVKPFDEEELSARIRSLMRRPQGLIPTTLAVGNLTLALNEKCVSVDGHPVKLGKKEYSVLEFLMRHPNRCFSSQELIEAVWPSDSDSTEDAVRACIRQLRIKITSKDGACIVSTVPGAGYTVTME
jgi:two-component system response regulator PhoP